MTSVNKCFYCKKPESSIRKLYHNIPVVSEKVREWAKDLNIATSIDVEAYSYVCGSHFEMSQFIVEDSKYFKHFFLKQS